MASETVVSDHSTACEELEKEEKPEVKKMEPETISPKESVENPKPGDLACPTAPSAESEARIEEKKIETPVIEEIKEISAIEKPVAESSVEVTAPPMTESTEQKIEKKLVECPPTDEKKTEDTPIVEAKDIQEVVKYSIPEPETASISEPISETIQCRSEEKTETETAAKQEESKLESVEEKPEELPNKVDMLESSSVEVVEDKLEKVEELPAKEVEAIELKDVKFSEAECKAEEISESVPLVEEKPLDKSEVTKQTAKEPTVVEPVKDVEVETPIDKVGDSNLPMKVEAAKEEIKIQEKDVECSLSEKTGKTIEEKEPAKETVEVEGLSEEKAIEPGKIEDETETPEAKTEEKIVVADESAKCEGKPIEHATSSIPPPKVSERATEEEVTSKYIELVAENGKKDETVASSETTKDAEVDEKVGKEATKTETKEKIEEKAQATEEEKQVNEWAKTDVQNPESTKDCEETKTTQDAPKEDVPVKTQKQSNNIIKMMKHSLIKAKKAIIGKSQNSKSPAASEP